LKTPDLRKKNLETQKAFWGQNPRYGVLNAFWAFLPFVTTVYNVHVPFYCCVWRGTRLLHFFLFLTLSGPQEAAVLLGVFSATTREPRRYVDK